MSDVLRIENLSAGYGDIQIIHEVTMNIPEGKIVTVVGPNGAGKSDRKSTRLNSSHT